ncbi:crooked neck-like protein 1 [Grus japonensis]|uniref:Crooked neck-like protein 1 n=1 Tax=Grus japonensis TaxID=30415 RepID=A0ABC9WQV6_GRUJA
MASTAAGKQRIPKVAKVKNKAPAEVQITAEQLLREAKERELELLPPPPQQKITDVEELNDYKLRKRKNWIKYARFEEKHSYFAHARKVYERAVEFFGEEHMDEHLYVAFAKFEENQKEFERVRVIYKYALDRIPKHEAQNLFKNYTIFEKKFGDRRGIEDIIVSKRRFQYEEEVKDAERTRQVYQACIELIPHKKGTSIGKCPKNKLFKGYIELELQLREFDRCRKLYEKFLEFAPENCTSWIKFAELETILGDIDRARAIYELAIGQPRLDMPEVLWKSYIDFEIEQEEYEKTRNLYRRLLQRTQHVKVWISFAQFELSAGREGSLSRCRQIYEEANKAMRNCEEKEERVMLLESWRNFEEEFGTDTTKERIDKLMPEKIKKRRKLQAEDGSDAGWEEYYDYIFPEDTANQPNLKLLAMAKLWKKQQQESEAAEMDPDKDIDESQS